MQRGSSTLSLTLLLALLAACSRAVIRPEKTLETHTGPGAQAEPPAAPPQTPEAPPAQETPPPAAPTAPPAAPPAGPVVRFDFDSARLTPAARAELDRFAADWKAGRFAHRLLVEGHCDERGTEEYNVVLGQKRADAVRRYLAALGVPHEGLDAVSFGRNRPLVPRSDEAAWAANRRAHVRLAGEQRTDAGTVGTP